MVAGGGGGSGLVWFGCHDGNGGGVRGWCFWCILALVVMMVLLAMAIVKMVMAMMVVLLVLVMILAVMSMRRVVSSMAVMLMLVMVMDVPDPVPAHLSISPRFSRLLFYVANPNSPSPSYRGGNFLALKVPDSRGYYPGEKGYRPDQVPPPPQQGQGGPGQEQGGYMEGAEAFVPDGYGGFVRRQNPQSPQGKKKVRDDCVHRGGC